MTECEIRKITAPFLIKQLFAIHAPALELEGEWPRLFRDDFMKPITIKVRPTQNDYLSKVRDLKPYHRKLIVDVLEKCDLMPKNRDEMNKGLA